jgi:chromosome segregation ATPase
MAMRRKRTVKGVSDRLESLGESVVDRVEDAVDDAKHRLSEVGDKIGSTAKDAINAANDTIDDAKAKVDDAKAKVDDAKARVEDAKAKVNGATRQRHGIRRKTADRVTDAQEHAHERAVALRDNRRRLLPVLLASAVSVAAALLVQMRARKRSGGAPDG